MYLRCVSCITQKAIYNFFFLFFLPPRHPQSPMSSTPPTYITWTRLLAATRPPSNVRCPRPYALLRVCANVNNDNTRPELGRTLVPSVERGNLDVSLLASNARPLPNPALFRRAPIDTSHPPHAPPSRSTRDRTPPVTKRYVGFRDVSFFSPVRLSPSLPLSLSLSPVS